jgi:hypothetical protein
MLHARDKIGVGLERQAGQRFGKVTRTYLTGSTRTMNGLGKAQLRFFFHALYLFGIIVLHNESSDKITRIEIAYFKFMFFLSPPRERIKVRGYLN